MKERRTSKDNLKPQLLKNGMPPCEPLQQLSELIPNPYKASPGDIDKNATIALQAFNGIQDTTDFISIHDTPINNIKHYRDSNVCLASTVLAHDSISLPHIFSNSTRTEIHGANMLAACIKMASIITGKGITKVNSIAFKKPVHSQLDLIAYTEKFTYSNFSKDRPIAIKAAFISDGQTIFVRGYPNDEAINHVVYPPMSIISTAMNATHKIEVKGSTLLFESSKFNLDEISENFSVSQNMPYIIAELTNIFGAKIIKDKLFIKALGSDMSDRINFVSRFKDLEIPPEKFFNNGVSVSCKINFEHFNSSGEGTKVITAFFEFSNSESKTIYSVTTDLALVEKK